MFKDIIGNRKVLNKKKDGPEWQIKVIRNNDEETWEPMHLLRKDDPLSLVQYAHDNNLINQIGLSNTRDSSKIVRLITKVNALKAQNDKARNKFKFGIQVPDDPRHAHLLDKLNGDP